MKKCRSGNPGSGPPGKRAFLLPEPRGHYPGVHSRASTQRSLILGADRRALLGPRRNRTFGLIAASQNLGALDAARGSRWASRQRAGHRHPHPPRQDQEFTVESVQEWGGRRPSVLSLLAPGGRYSGSMASRTSTAYWMTASARAVSIVSFGQTATTEVWPARGRRCRVTSPLPSLETGIWLGRDIRRL